MSIKTAVKVDGKTYFTYEIKDSQGDGTGLWSDPLVEQDMFSRTFLPKGTVVFKANTVAKMVTEVKKKKYKFKAESLSDESKAIFKEKKILSKIKTS